MPYAEAGIGRRSVLAGSAGLLGSRILLERPAAAQSAARKSALIIGIDFSDTLTLDPARVRSYTNPMPTRAAYDPLVKLTDDDYTQIKPCLSTDWAYLPDGKTVRFKLRDDVMFVSGNNMTAEDVRFSFMRLLHLGEQPSQYIAHVDHVEAVDRHTVDFALKDSSLPLLTIIAAPEFGITEKAVVVAHGGTDAADARDADKAGSWLDTNSAGTGAFRLVGWQRNEVAQLVRNPNFWAATPGFERPGFERVVIRHMNESAQQLVALQRGDIDVAFNLIPEQIATLKDDPSVNIVRETSLDFMYMALAESPENPPLKDKRVRQAIANAIDYDGIIRNILGGNAVRPCSFLPVGANGSTEALTREIGFRDDVPRAKKLLADAGLPEGFSFRLTYANAAFNGVKYSDVAQKLQSDLARAGIRAELAPTDPVSLTSQYLSGHVQAVMASWNPVTVENQLWASGSIVRVAQRLHWNVPPEFRQLVHDAGAERDPAKAAALWEKYQRGMVDFAHLVVLFQPIYQVPVRKTVAG
ncbi:MAG TPA: ABC transporter substrate-binding protein, partial [Acetobacteraceae bacterium]|nr:ABC transporter substrate-binding protein [Acetobacteraceae bacterium]